MSEDYMKEVIEAYPYPGKGKVAIDLGANKGDYTSLLLNKFDKVYAVEPFPENIKHLEDRFYEEICDNRVIIVPKAISHKNGKAKLYVNGKDTEATLSKIFAQSGAWNYNTGAFIEVETITLDRLFYDEIPNIGFIKVDVEGAEHTIFRGADSLLSNLDDKCWIVLEAHLLVDWDDLNDLFKMYNYKFMEDGFKAVDEMCPGNHYLIHKSILKFKMVVSDE